MASQQLDTKIRRVVEVVLAGVLVLVPFHALFTTWAGSNFGHLDAFVIWKEVIIVAITLPALWLVGRDVKLRQWLRYNWLARLVGAYALLHIVLGAWTLQRSQVNSVALIHALLINLRFLGFFMIVLVVVARSDWLRQHWQRLALWPAFAVITFGLLQRFVLPYDFLRHFGYAQNTIPAYQTVDQKLDFRRIQSTLRGANPLGAYLVLIIVVLVRRIRRAPVYIIPLLGAGVVLLLSQSRSAWIGTVVALVVWLWLSGDLRIRRQLLIAISIGVVVTASSLWVLRDNNFVQNTFFHTDETSASAESSNQGRLKAMQTAADEVVRQPLGRGPGTAGPASFRNSSPPRIAENYYLQIAQEVGWLGAGLFIAINVLVAWRLWAAGNDPLARLLLASLAGLTVVNLVSHAWTDDTLAYAWWGLCGIALAPGILPMKHKHHGKP
jgi:hypothetical protein